MMNRREAIQKTGVVAGALLVSQTLPLVAEDATAGSTAPFTLPKLPYEYDALEPHMDALTLQIHHDKHHAAYVANLNKAVASEPAIAGKPIEELLQDLSKVPSGVRSAVRNQGGGHYNHTLFWQMLRKDGGGEPSGELASALNGAFGSFAEFKTRFSEAAMKHFGSGWAWLILSDDKKLSIVSTPNQDTPLSEGKWPVVGIDVWEHAYYLKHQNRRVEFVDAFFKMVNWDFAAERFAKKS